MVIGIDVVGRPRIMPGVDIMSICPKTLSMGWRTNPVLWQRALQGFALQMVFTEQEKIVQSLEASHLRQSFTWRVVFATLTLVFSGFFLISAYWQAISPWELKYHAYFMEDMNSVTVVVADVAEGIVYASMAWGLLSSKSIHNHLLWISFGAGLGLAVFWLYYIQSLSRMRWDLLWLPLGPCSCAALCLYVDHLLVETGRDVGKLRTAMYHFKRN